MSILVSSGRSLAPSASVRVPAPFALVLPFTVIGVAGSVLVTDAFFGHALGGSSSGFESLGASGATIASVTATCALLGVLVRRLLPRNAFLGAALVAVAAGIGGVFAGALAALLSVAPLMTVSSPPPVDFITIGAGLGLAFSVPFIPALVAVFLAGRASAACGARAGSVIARAERDRVWVATASAVVVAALMGALFEPERPAPLGLAVAATLSLGVLVVTALQRLERQTVRFTGNYAAWSPRWMASRLTTAA